MSEVVSFVVGDDLYRFETLPTPGSVRTRIAVTRGDSRWEFDGLLGRQIGFGTQGKRHWAWTASGVIVMAAGAEPYMVRVDEDVLAVFSIASGWLVVCEISTRIVTDKGEVTSLIPSGEVIVSANFSSGVLRTRDDNGGGLLVRVSGNQLESVG